MAIDKNLIVQEMADGRIIMMPKKDDHPMSSEEFESLTIDQKEVISKDQEEVGQFANSVLNQQTEFSQKLRDDVRQIERDFASKLIVPAIKMIASKYDNKKLQKWLLKVKTHMLDNVHNFREKEGNQQQSMNAMLGVMASPEDSLDQYSINVIVDNSKLKGCSCSF